MKHWLKKIDGWWFSFGHPLPLSILRIGVGIIAFLNFCLLFYYRKEFFYESGMTTNAFVETWSNGILFTLLRGETLDTLVDLIFYSGMLSSILMALGLFSRASTIAVTLLTLTIQHRNPFILHGSDTLLKLILIYLCFAKTGAYLSLDIHWLKKKVEKSIPLWPQRLIAFQLAVVYGSTVFEKLLSISWKNGSALYYVLRLEAYQRLPLPEFLTLPPFTVIATYGTIITEILLVFAPFSKKIRNKIVPFGILLHLGIMYSMNIPLFCELTMLLYVSLYSGEELSRFKTPTFLKTS